MKTGKATRHRWLHESVAVRSADWPHMLRGCTAVTLLSIAVLACSGTDAADTAGPETFDPRPMRLVPDIRASEATRDAVRRELSADARGLSDGVTARERGEIQQLYDAQDHVPMWVDAAGRPDEQALAALALIASAADDGLRPEAYGWPRVSQQAKQLAEAPADAPVLAEVAAFDVTLSAAMLRYLRHLHLGRVDPRTIGLQLVVPVEPHDFVLVLRDALQRGRVAELHSDMTPPLMQYQALREMLARYRVLAERTDLAGVPLPPTSVKPGDLYDGAGALYAQLLALGDLPADTPPPAGSAGSDVMRYADVLVEGVRQFQRRHGLDPDGVLGKGTVAALNVPLSWRTRQIELALERMRWLPDLDDRRLVGLNIPMFQFWAWDAAPGGPPAFGMRAIVGRALSTQTPVFTADLQQVVFRPYWNVPRSILRNELLPAIERDIDYLRRQDMEMVRGWGDNAPVVAATAENVALLRAGTLRLRQRPGPRNALGLVKFDFPNTSDVYMHGTPAQALFSRARRDFSHGCVRVEDPLAFAEWVLRDQPGWTRAEIEVAADGSRTQYVRVARPIRVVLFYTTAAVMPADGTVHFAEDIYRHDARLDGALER